MIIGRVSSTICSLALFQLLVSVTASPTYEPAIALKAAYYSASTYCKRAIIESWTCGTPCSNFPGVTTVKSFAEK